MLSSSKPRCECCSHKPVTAALLSLLGTGHCHSLPPCHLLIPGEQHLESGRCFPWLPPLRINPSPSDTDRQVFKREKILGNGLDYFFHTFPAEMNALVSPLG